MIRRMLQCLTQDPQVFRLLLDTGVLTTPAHRDSSNLTTLVSDENPQVFRLHLETDGLTTLGHGYFD